MGSDAYGPVARRDGEDLLLVLKVTPGAASDEVLMDQPFIKVRITAPAVEGKANRYLKKYLGKLFKVPQSRVLIEKGESARHKTVRIVKPSRIPEILDVA